MIIKVLKIKNSYQAQLYISVPPASTINKIREPDNIQFRHTITRTDVNNFEKMRKLDHCSLFWQQSQNKTYLNVQCF